MMLKINDGERYVYGAWFGQPSARESLCHFNDRNRAGEFGTCADPERMIEMTKYFQCTLSQGTGRSIGWIEERGARIGALVEVKDDGFDGLWRVDQVADKGFKGADLREHQRVTPQFPAIDSPSLLSDNDG